MHFRKRTDNGRKLLAIRERVFTAVVQELQLKTVNSSLGIRLAIGTLIARIVTMRLNNLNAIAAFDLLLSKDVARRIVKLNGEVLCSIFGNGHRRVIACRHGWRKCRAGQINADPFKHHIIATGNIRICGNGVSARLKLFRQVGSIKQNDGVIQCCEAEAVGACFEIGTSATSLSHFAVGERKTLPGLIG